MATKQNGSSRKTARNPWAVDKSASVRTSPPRALADAGGGGGASTESNPGDPPIIIQGGGSVTLHLPGKFKDNGIDPEGRRKFRDADQDLASVTIDGKACDVNAKSKIVIHFTQGGGGGGGRPGSGS